MSCPLSHDIKQNPQSCYAFTYAVPQGNLIADAKHGHTYDVTHTPLANNPIVYQSDSGVLGPLAVGTVVGTLQQKIGCHNMPPKIVGQCLVPLKNGKLPSVQECITSRAFADVSKQYH